MRLDAMKIHTDNKTAIKLNFILAIAILVPFLGIPSKTLGQSAGIYRTIELSGIIIDATVTDIELVPEPSYPESKSTLYTLCSVTALVGLYEHGCIKLGALGSFNNPDASYIIQMPELKTG